MGVPEFLKFVARSAPAALCRTPRAGDEGDALYFDYIFVDATNVAQTVGLDVVARFLTGTSVVARRAIVFALDSGRDRSGTARQHRQTHLMVNDLQVSVQQLCVRLQEHYDERQRQSARSVYGTHKTPGLRDAVPVHEEVMVLMSGRGVVGEADYKILDLHRHILAAALVSQGTTSTTSSRPSSDTLPTFLFVSEDSDLLCGALCGPAPQTVSIATTLHDTLFDLAVLRLSHVLAHVARCVDALHTLETDAPLVTSVAAAREAHATSTAARSPAVMASTATTSAAAADEPAGEATDVVRRRRQDGPMVATGVRIALADSDDDNNEDRGVGEKTAEQEAGEGAEQAEPPGQCDTVFAQAAGAITQASAVDLVFLFVLVLGNGADVPPLLPGVTKVDIAACWQAYCERKYDTAARHTPPTPTERQLGQTLVDVTGSKATASKASSRQEECAAVTLNCEFLHAILSIVHCADHQSRAPNEEDRARATALLSAALYATFRYIVGCNLASGLALRDSFLDGRALSEARASMATAPSLAAVLLLLQRESRMTFNYPLHGLLRPGQLLYSADGSFSAEQAHAAAATSSRLQLDVCASLTRPAAVAVWAVRGVQEISLYDVLERCYRLPRAAHDAVAGTTRVAKASVGSLVRYFAGVRQALNAASGRGASSGAIGTNDCDIFCALLAMWRQSVAQAVPQLCVITKSATTGVAGEAGAVLQLPDKQTNADGAARIAKPEGDHFIYSFELRRMAPVLRLEAQAADEDDGATVQRTAHEARKAQSALLHSVLGLSYDYVTAPAPTTTCDAATQPGRRTERLPKRPRSERRQGRSEATVTKNSCSANKSDVPTGNVTKDDSAGRKKRPGKTQRLRFMKQKHRADMTATTVVPTSRKAG